MGKLKYPTLGHQTGMYDTLYAFVIRLVNVNLTQLDQIDLPRILLNSRMPVSFWKVIRCAERILLFSPHLFNGLISNARIKSSWPLATRVRHILSPVAKNLNSTYHFVTLRACQTLSCSNLQKMSLLHVAGNQCEFPISKLEIWLDLVQKV